MNQRKLRFLIILACLAIVSIFAKMPAAYSCPPVVCGDCYIPLGSGCWPKCLELGCYDYDLCGDCPYDPNECYKLVGEPCPLVLIRDNYPGVTCVGCQAGFEGDYGPNYFPNCGRCLIWTASPYPEGGGEGDTFIHIWETTGLKEVKARLPCGSEAGVSVLVLKIEKVEMEVNGSWQDVTGANITVLKGTRYTFKATLEPTPPSWPSDIFSWWFSCSPPWLGDEIGNEQTIVETFDSEGTYYYTATLGCATGTNCRKDVTINVVAPTIYQFGFDNDHTLYKTPSAWGGWADGTTLITDPVYIDDTNNDNDKNDPVCVTKNSSSVSLSGVKLRIPQALTYSTPIHIDANGTYNWNESSDVSFSGTISSAATLGIKGNIINQVKKYNNNFQIQWKYRVLPPDSTNIRYGLGTTSHTVYVTYGTPDPGGIDLTEKRINWLCNSASDVNTAKGVADCIHSALNANPPIDGHDPTQTDGWALLSGTPYQGECDEQARFMVKGLKLLGSTGSAYYTYASTDSSVTSYESKVQDGKTWWLKFDFDNNGSVDNNFEGSVSSAGHYYAVWPSLDASSECLLLRQIGPDNLGAAQRWVRTYGDTFYGATLEHLPGTEPYPTCP